MKPFYLLPIISIILLVLCAAGCVAAPDNPATPTANPTPLHTLYPTATPTVLPNQGPADADKIIGFWKLSRNNPVQKEIYVMYYTLNFNADGTCTETNYWSDGDVSHLIGTWKKTGEDTYKYEVYRLFSVKDNVLHAWFDSRNLYGSKTFAGKWEQKDEDKEAVYVEYIINNDGTGTEVRKADINGETQSMNVPFTWKDFRNGNYQVVFSEEPKNEYTVQLLSGDKLLELELQDTLVRV